MAASIIKWVIIFLSLLNAGYMTYDGARALVKGDYIRPEKGEYAGKLGPWTMLAEKAGIDPMSTLMKSVFLVLGTAGLLITTCFMFNLSWAWKALLIFNICCLWNLVFGTASSVLQIILLLIMRKLQ